MHKPLEVVDKREEAVVCDLFFVVKTGSEAFLFGDTSSEDDLGCRGGECSLLALCVLLTADWMSVQLPPLVGKGVAIHI